MVVFSDLDGTLLDHDTYDWQAARPALDELARRHVPLVLVSSKTLAELDDYRHRLDLEHPVVAENGAVIDLPSGYFGGSLTVEMPEVSRGSLQQAYRAAKARLDLDCSAFFEMGIDGIVEATGLDRDQAARANDRLASEPILWRDSDAALARFTDAMGAEGFRCVRGGRFVHLMPDTDKARATGALADAYRRHWPGNDIITIALGDGPNDIRMLEAADVAVVIPGKHEHDMTLGSDNLCLHPRNRGPEGWNEAMHLLLDQYGTNET